MAANQPSTATAFDKLHRALHPVDPNNLDGPYYLNMVGTANIIGAGSGGTSQIDNSSFVPGASSLTPIGGYVGGRSVASGNTAAPAMNASGMLIVAVGAGGAGGGLAQLQVVGSDNSTFQNVGYPSGGSPSLNAVPVNVVGGLAAQATVNIAGQPISVVGSVNPHGIFGSVSMVGSVGVTPLSTFTVALDKIPTVNLGLGTINVGNIPAIVGSVWVANPAAGGGFASAAVYGSPANPVYNVGSVNVVNTITVTGTVNTVGAGGGGGFASAAVYGSPAMPVYVVGSVNVVNQAANSGFASVAVYGSPGNPVYAVGSVNVVNNVGVTQVGAPWSVIGSAGVSQLGAPWSLIGSAGVTPLATFTVALDKIPTVNLGLGTVNIGNIPAVVGSVFVTGAAAMSIGGVQVVDTRGSLVPTTWPISFAGSGYFAIAAAPGASKVVKFYTVHVTSENSAVMSFQSPSGTFLTGSIRVPGAAGFNIAGQLGNPLLIGATNATFFLHIIGSQNVGGWAAGWVE